MSSAQDDAGVLGGEAQILVTAESGIATITINRPRQLNALTKGMWTQLTAEVTRLDNDDSVNVLIIRGAGGHAFSAGADIKEFRANRADLGWITRYNAAVANAEDAIASTSKPTIAMVEGHCIGGGCAVAVACDIRLAAATSQFGVPVAKMGLVYSLASTRRLVELVGPSEAKILLFSARALSSGEACQIGLANRVLEPGALIAETYSLAAAISSGSPFSVRAAKEIVRLVLDGVRTDNAETHAMQSQAAASEHYARAVSAFTAARSARVTARGTA
jgi:enoyl-CoA hydratase/carnithine racemase